MVDACGHHQDPTLSATWDPCMGPFPVEAPDSGYVLLPSDQGIEGHRPLPPHGPPQEAPE